MMWRFALRTVRARTSAYLAAAAVIAAGTALLVAFAALVTSGNAVADGRGESLTMLALIMGGWTVVVVIFGIAATVSLVIAQRTRELALIRSIGAVPRQVRALVLVETVAVAVPALLAGVLPGTGLGGLLLDRMAALGVVTVSARLVVHGSTIVAGAGVSLLAAVIAALLAGRRAATIAPVQALAGEAGPAGVALSRTKARLGALFLVIGFGSGVGTLFMADGPLLAAGAGPACIGVAIGLALLSPATVAIPDALTARLPSSTSRLALRNLAARAAEATPVVGALTLLIGIATGTLYMQATEDSITNRAPDDVAPQFAAANYMIVGLIIAFSAITVANSLVAATWKRRREFGLLRLTAVTRRQVLGMVVIESAAATFVSVVLGTVAAAATIVPYSLVKTGSPIPGGPGWMFPAIVASGFAVALAATTATSLRATREPPLTALGVGG
ncbi:ABC transporter permease [Nocardia panacis]|uniref:ABC transporter permease n=1 Tax=Nocardia panacis TaxID=2340916 RepID=A0A3A4KIU7_9NOCA|nr:FtsX-like permease family protein [Nocardia panacis]RJO73613.1 ABC transporter permease [Nocardia panacis]